jgi:hypothetical protein
VFKKRFENVLKKVAQKSRQKKSPKKYLKINKKKYEKKKEKKIFFLKKKKKKVLKNETIYSYALACFTKFYFILFYICRAILT